MRGNGGSLRFASGGWLDCDVSIQLHPPYSNKIASMIPFCFARERLGQDIRNLIHSVDVDEIEETFRKLFSKPRQRSSLGSVSMTKLCGISSLNDVNCCLIVFTKGNFELLIQMNI